MPRDNSNKYRKSSPKDVSLSLSLLQLQLRNLSLKWTSECVSKWGANLLIYTSLACVEVSLHWQGRLLKLGGYNHLYYISGPLDIF